MSTCVTTLICHPHLPALPGLECHSFRGAAATEPPAGLTSAYGRLPEAAGMHQHRTPAVGVPDTEAVGNDLHRRPHAVEGLVLAAGLHERLGVAARAGG